ncbi:MAG: HAMP domain-containing protein [Rhodobacteraceae bacterium]|nr:HAMP domain-containing protein [Paracoccaceae bacterium]
MFNKWLKPYLPRSLFGRAILILIVPIVLIQVVVGIVFVERLFQDVTRQMTVAASLDINYLVGQLKTQGSEKAVSEEVQLAGLALEIDTKPLQDGADLIPDQHGYFDVSGRFVIETLHRNIPGILWVDLLRDNDFVILAVSVDASVVEFQFSRRRVSAANPHQLLVAMVIAAILLTTLSALFLRNQVQPIRRLAAAAEAFGKGQSLAFKPRGASEVRSASHAFLSMRARIERQIEQRTLMLSGVSHDLRTPLTRMKLSVSLMDQDAETELMQRDLDEMEEILDEFLAFARGDSGETSELVQPKVLAKQLIKNQRRSGADVELHYTGNTQDDTAVPMRKMAVQRALGNLLGNAQKHGRKLRLTLYLGTGFIDFIVEDDGPGIRKDQREDAVKPFARLDEARNQNQGSGVGLGLAIAADVARSHGGAMTLGHSDDLGGLKVNFRMPR